MARPLPFVLLALFWLSGYAQSGEAHRFHPDRLIFQYAGNLGAVSAGVGWQTSAHTEVNLLAGYAPESLEGVDIYVAGVKGNYVFNPLADNEAFSLRLYTGLAFLYYFGDRYTTYDYPHGYYTYPSHEWHFMPYLGIKLTSNEPAQRGISLYSELGAIDAYLIHYYNNRETLGLDEAVNLSVGLTIPLD